MSCLIRSPVQHTCVLARILSVCEVTNLFICFGEVRNEILTLGMMTVMLEPGRGFFAGLNIRVKQFVPSLFSLCKHASKRNLRRKCRQGFLPLRESSDTSHRRPGLGGE